MARGGCKNKKGVKPIPNGCGYMHIFMPEHENAKSKGYVYEHVLVASRALGRPLPKGCEVHHVNGVGTDNRNENLVICDSLAYHKLIHKRTEAYLACGNASYRKCQFCGKWENPGTPGFYSPWKQAYHKACRLAALHLKQSRRFLECPGVQNINAIEASTDRQPSVSDAMSCISMRTQKTRTASSTPTATVRSCGNIC